MSLSPKFEDLGRTICRLTYQVDGLEGSIELVDHDLLIGRASDADLVLSHESVSRHHARIVPGHRGWEIVDLESKNGIKLNTFRVESEKLRTGDRIDIGAARIFVEIIEGVHSNATNVIFRKDDDRHGKLRTESIDMGHMDLLFAYSAGDDSVPRSGLDAAWPEVSSGSLSGKVSDPVALLRLFSEATETLLSCESLGDALDRILALVFRSVPAERGVICLYNDKSDELEPKVMRTLDGIPDESIQISNQIARSAIEEKRSILVQNTMTDDRFGGAESIITMKIHSAMCAPLYRKGKVAGVIYVDRRSPRDLFQTHHLQALSTLAYLSVIAIEQASLRDELHQEQQLRSRLARYSSPAVVERILRAPGELERDMVADEGEVSVLFADLTDFTSMAENLRPSDVIQVLNQTFERLSSAVFSYEGTLDKFRGDGMMAFFGAPLAQPDHAERAVKAALRMQALLADMNAQSHNRRFISMRIGINSGPVVVGDIGSPQRKDYTVIGDVVNIASRLESSVAQPGQVVIGARTYRQVGNLFNCQELPTARLKGRIRTVRPYLVLGRKESARNA